MENKYKFTKDWFSNNIERWNAMVVPYLKSLKGRHIKCLEVGVFEGRSALWTVENGGLLDHPQSQMWLVDNWTRTRSCWSNLLANLNTFKAGHPGVPSDKIMVCRGDIVKTLRTPQFTKKMFDFIYLDLHGDSKDMMETAALVWPLLKPGGMMVFDDYTSNKEHDGACMKQGVDAFLDLYARELSVKHMSWQVVVMKRKRPLRRIIGCRSEYYDT